MPTVTLSRYECSADLVPAVCAVCGEPGAERLAHTFSWRPSWREARGLADWWTTQTATVRLPLCREHARHQHRKNQFVIITLLPMLALMAVALGPLLGLFRGLGPVGEMVVMSAAALLVLGWAGALHFFFADRFRPAEITDRTVTLRGVHRRFVAAVAGDLEPDRRPPEDRATAEDPATASEPAPGVTEVNLTEAEYEADDLPSLCARCGAPADNRVRRRVRILPHKFACLWSIPFLAGLIFCPPLFILLLVVFGKRVEIRVPMCPEHENHWAMVDRVGGRLVLPIWSLVATGLTVCAVLDSDDRWLYVVGAVLTLVAVIGLERIMVRDLVMVLGAEGTDVRFKHVHPAFAAAVAAERERRRPERPAPVRRPEDEWDDYDDEAMDRRSRPAPDEWDDYDDDHDYRSRRRD